MEKIDFQAEAQRLHREIGNDYPNKRLTLHLENARELLSEGLQAFCENPQWLPAYDEIVDWMKDSKAKGLCLIGNCGTGKTLICSQILPVIFQRYEKILRTFVAMDLNQNTDKVLASVYKVIDDIGTEGAKMDYGEKRMVFSELVDRVERKGEFLIVTSNLTPDEIKTKYGERTLDRLCSITRLITIKGDSMRR